MKQIEEIKSQMVSYDCHKTVKASPMSKLEYAKLMKNPEPYEDEPGYIVMYEDGYISWSPKEAFDKGYRLSETFTDRLKNEMEELEEKCQKLNDFIESPKFDSLEETHKNLLKTQFYAMGAYYGAVRTRYDILTQSSAK